MSGLDTDRILGLPVGDPFHGIRFFGFSPMADRVFKYLAWEALLMGRQSPLYYYEDGMVRIIEHHEFYK